MKSTELSPSRQPGTYVQCSSSPTTSPARCRRRSELFEEESPCQPNDHEESTRNEIVQQFNSRNAKFLAFFIICGFVLYHTILRLTHGIDSCKWLLSDGNYRDQVWQPYGCMMHHYSHIDARLCLRYMEYLGGKNHFVFIGDSRMEQVYHGFIHQISPGYRGVEPLPPSYTSIPTTTKLPRNGVDEGFDFPFERLSGRDLSYNDSQLGLRIQFVWCPHANKSMVLALQKFQTTKQLPSVVVIGSGGYSIKDSDPLDPNVLEEYTASLTHVVLHIDKLAQGKGRLLWALQEPVDSDKLSEDWLTVTNELIDLYNRQSQKILRYSKGDIWSSGRSVAMENIAESPDGFHLGPKTLFQDSQILLNMYCNDNMNYNDATCCSSSEKISKLQIVTFATLLICFLFGCILFVRRRCELRGAQRGRRYTRVHHVDVDVEDSADDPAVTTNQNQCDSLNSAPSDCYALFTALAKVTLILAFFFICDRTTMFMKENKYFTQTNFWLPVIYILVLGIFFTEDSNFTKVLHPDQNLEVKGWMVLTILVYNMMGASQVLPIYLFVKTLYSALLFLHGWNQFLSFMQRGDFTLGKFLQDLFRLNVMTVLLCVTMNRPYQFYEFVPLISFWTVVLHIALSLPPRITWAACEANSLNYLYLVFKIIGIVSFTTILYISEVFFEKVFVTRPWKALFVTTDDDIHDWWTRWKIDRYSMAGGIVAAFAFTMARRSNILKDDNHGNLFSMRICLLAVLFSIGGIGAYATFSCLCRNQMECLEIHSYVVFVPILGYILLRNVSGILRTRFSTFFAWFGQFWIELLVGQYHVWLGADGHGVLVLVPAYPVGNVLLTAFVFASTAHEIHCCTETLLPYAVPENWRKSLRNAFVFLLILIPIGVSDGMF